jgi:diguanylate cyclase (GGDEF)-like protein
MTVKKPLNLKSTANALHKSAGLHGSVPWRVLVVDDEADVHAVTRLILSKIIFKHRPIELLTANSAAEAQQLLHVEKNIAVILLDVVMETDDAGLRLVEIIRNQLCDPNVRIILRTGQPGQAPEERVIIDYDINDYKAKSELTSQKLFTTVIAALRAYETIMSLHKNRQGLEKILHSSDSLFKIQSMQQFASGILTQLSAFLGCKPQGIICIEENKHEFSDLHPSEIKVIAVTAEFECCLKCNLDESCGHTEIMPLIKKTLEERKSQFDDKYTVFYLDTIDNKATIALVCSETAIDESDRYLLEVFTSKISIALANAIHYQKMVSFEKASTTDFLTGLCNRRQLLRLGFPLLSHANRSKTPVVVAMMDVDFFKRINDSHGHDSGDLVLQQIGVLLSERFKRRSDVIARYGGEEFCIIAAHVDESKVFELFDSFRAMLENQLINLPTQTLSITVSIGVSTKLRANLDDMISEADRLLYQAKQAGRNCVMMD